jgi:hypothetical protein
MPLVQFWDFWWDSADHGGSSMAPNETHYYISYPFNQGDVVNFMAYAVSGVPGEPIPEDANSQLIVENVYTSVDANGQYTVVFNVKNVGLTYIGGYNVGSSVINR